MSKVEKKVEEIKGELTYEDKVIQKIIGLSLENVPGLLAIDGGFFSNLSENLSILITLQAESMWKSVKSKLLLI